MGKQLVERVQGKVKWFNQEKGYGFITYNNEDYFVPCKQIVGREPKYLEPEETVMFSPRDNKFKPGQKIALYVEVISSEK